jgi:hypothetical protein
MGTVERDDIQNPFLKAGVHQAEWMRSTQFQSDMPAEEMRPLAVKYIPGTCSRGISHISVASPSLSKVPLEAGGG